MIPEQKGPGALTPGQVSVTSFCSLLTENTPADSSPTAAERADADDNGSIAFAVATLCWPGMRYELRALGWPRKGTISGYYSDHEKLSRDAQYLEDMGNLGAGHATGIFMSLNPVNSRLVARANNRYIEWAKHTTADDQIARRVWLLLDFDAERPSGVSATDAEHEAAIQRMLTVREWLLKARLAEPLAIDSGNGGHLLIPFDAPNDEEATLNARGIVDNVADIFSDSHVAVDRSVFNAARLLRIPGTTNRKGDDLPDWPHRRSRFIHVPDALNPRGNGRLPFKGSHHV